MPTTQAEMSEPWRRAHGTARSLHDALATLGVPETELGRLTARDGGDGRLRIAIPPLSPESVSLLLRALGPQLGPAFVGRRDDLPTQTGHPA